MSSENEEVVRIIMMLGQAVCPRPRDIVRMTMRGMARVGLASYQAGRFAVSAAASHVDGFGRSGIVAMDRTRREPTHLIDVSDIFSSRRDLHELGRICREKGIGMAVWEDAETGYLGIEYKMRDASAMEGVVDIALKRGIITTGDIADAMGRREALQAGAPTKAHGHAWTPSEDKGRLQAKGVDADGAALTASVAKNGTWGLTDADGAIKEIAGHEMRGQAPTVDEALVQASAALSSAGDAEIVKHAVAAKHDTKTMTLGRLKTEAAKHRAAKPGITARRRTITQPSLARSRDNSRRLGL
ncbi:MAG: hypothetical protein E7001_00475 [Coriobacteriaceae bacterium]|nr:hypothetical protein [Coriobacteriaceae bacterium]